MGWWFGRILTFEMIADAADVPLGALLGDASGGRIASDSAVPVVGFAAYGTSMRAALGSLADAYGLTLFDDGQSVRDPSSTIPIAISEDQFGNSADAKPAARIERSQVAAGSLPARLSLDYYDPDRDYQTGRMQASAGDLRGPDERTELALVVGADAAKTLVEEMFARRWAQRDMLTLRLPPSAVVLEPGCVVDLPLAPRTWTVQRCTIDAMVTVVDLRPTTNLAPTIAADSGRVLSSMDVVRGSTTVALFDLPDLSGDAGPSPTLMLAAADSSPSWTSVAVEISAGGTTSMVASSARQAVLGSALTVLGGGQAYLIDGLGTVDVALIDPTQWLTSCSDDAIVHGENLCVVGSELIQFGSAQPIGLGRFRLSRLVRGRAGTEWAIAGHGDGETFVMISAATLRALPMPAASRGVTVTAKPTGPQNSGASVIAACIGAEAQRPPAPIGLAATLTPAGDLSLTWVRRSRLGWGWADEIDAPIGESSESYRVSAVGSSASVEVTVATAEATLSAAQLASLGPGPVTLQVRQIGDFAASRPASTIFNQT